MKKPTLVHIGYDHGRLPRKLKKKISKVIRIRSCPNETLWEYLGHVDPDHKKKLIEKVILNDWKLAIQRGLSYYEKYYYNFK